MSARRGRAAWVLTALLALGGLTAGCRDDAEDEATDDATMASSTSGTSEAKEGAMNVNEWETKTDPVEGAFTIELPKGWKNDAYLKRKGIITVNIATAESPDGGAALFYNDPKMPSFVEPHAAVPQNYSDPNVKVQPYQAAEQFLPGYLKNRFGKLPGFNITGVSPAPELVARNRESAQRVGANLSQLHSARVDFEFTQGGGKPRRGAVYGTTWAMGGMIWGASVAGIVGTGDPLGHKETLFHLIWSQKALPEWKEKERVAAADRQRQHEYVMAQIAAGTEQLRVNHASNMANLNGMAVRHQARMDAIHAAGDASTAAYKARDAASDNNQRGFLNYINDEHTVAGSSGRTFQVDNKYDRYYLNKTDNSYIGVKGGTTLNDLPGVNPGDYEEGSVLR